MLFIGRTRFSLFDPKSSSWKASNSTAFKNIDEYKNYLFSDERLRLRAEIFFNLSLPQLAASAESYDVRHIVSYSEFLPDKYENMLKDAQSKYDFLVLDRQSSNTSIVDVNRFAKDILSESSDPRSPYGVYRLDDDDLLPVDFFERCSIYVTRSNIGMLVSFGAGLTAIYMNGKFYNTRECYAPMIGIGLLGIHGFDENGDLWAPRPISHNRSDRANPVILDSRSIGFMWTRHVEQDSTLGPGTSTPDSILDRIRKQINQYPPATATSEVEELFPVLSGIVTAAKDELGSLQIPAAAKTRLIKDPIGLQFSPKTGHVQFDFIISGDSNSRDKNALISFEFLDASQEGGQVGKKWAPILAKSHISVSDNKQIGYFKYLNTGIGRHRSKVEIEIPEGLTLVGAKLMKWRKMDATLVVESSSVVEL